jgi:hypothetical protein
MRRLVDMGHEGHTQPHTDLDYKTKMHQSLKLVTIDILTAQGDRERERERERENSQ